MKPEFFAAKQILEALPAVDYHIHSTFTDGAQTVTEAVSRAMSEGLQAIAITDHARRASTYCGEYVREIEAVQAEHQELTIFKGLEVKITNLSGDLDLPQAIVPSLDMVIGVIHRFPCHEVEPLFAPTSELTAEQAVELECQASIAMMRRGEAHVLGHPGRTFSDRFHLPFPEAALRRLVEAAAEHGTAIELNARCDNLGQVLRLALEAGCLVSLGSDAHCLDEIGRIGKAMRQILAEQEERGPRTSRQAPPPQS